MYRLTLIKGFNIEDEAEGYADFVARGLPCFVEVKGVTYCGTSSSAGARLTMQNVPFYNEVIAFVEALDAALARRGLVTGLLQSMHTAAASCLHRTVFSSEVDDIQSSITRSSFNASSPGRGLRQRIMLVLRRRSGLIGATEGSTQQMRGSTGKANPRALNMPNPE